MGDQIIRLRYRAVAVLMLVLAAAQIVWAFAWTFGNWFEVSAWFYLVVALAMAAGMAFIVFSEWSRQGHEALARTTELWDPARMSPERMKVLYDKFPNWDYTGPMPLCVGIEKERLSIAEAEAAIQRAEAALFEHLDDHQIASYQKGGYFVILDPRNPRRHWVIVKWGHAEIKVVENGELTQTMCVYPRDGPVCPAADVALANLLWLKVDPWTIYAKAVHYAPSRQRIGKPLTRYTEEIMPRQDWIYSKYVETVEIGE